MPNQLILYTGTWCHLCEQAKAVVYSVIPPGLTVREINVDDYPELKDIYGLKIPVFALKGESGTIVAEKGWPFTSGQIRKLLTEHNLL